jgi:hypothetical protein
MTWIRVFRGIEVVQGVACVSEKGQCIRIEVGQDVVCEVK